MPRSSKRFSLLATPLNFSRRMSTGILLLNLLVIAIAVFTIHEDRLEHERRARSASQNLAHLLANDLNNAFGRSDLVLRTVVSDIEEHLVAGTAHRTQLNDFLRLQQSYLPEIISLRVADENGLVRYGEGVPTGTPVDISDREYFILQKGNAKAGLVIAKPVKARISKEWTVPLSRRINRPDGNFAGIAYINIPAAYFTRKFGELDLGSHGLVVMRSADNTSMARFPEMLEGGGAIGQIAISEQLRGLLKDNPESVSYIAPSPADHMERIFSYRKLPQFPLYVVVGLALQDILNEWWWDTAQTLAMVALFTVTTILFAWLLVRSWRRQLAISEVLGENEQRWSFALESGNFAVWDWDIQSGNVQLSKLGKRLFGFEENEIGDHMAEWAARCHPDDMNLVESRLKDHFRKRAEIFTAEFRVRCKDGSWKWILARGLVVKRAEDGRPLRMIGLHSDISERKQHDEQMHYLALHDALTDLPNRILLTERLQQAILRAHREKSSVGLLYFDLDKFKPVNDTYGHEVGDWLLKSVADRVRACVRESDTVSRLGGDEFVVLLAYLDNDSDALKVAEKIREALNLPFNFAEISFEISCSMGVAIYPKHGDNEITLTRNADTAMYHAKKNGRNQVVLYRDGIQQD